MKERVRAADRWVGGGEPAFVVAEAGSNHNRDLRRAKELVDAAAKAGADAIKFQLYAAGDLYPEGTSPFKALEATELPPEWLPELRDRAADRGLIFFASPFSPAAVDALEDVGVPLYKGASSEAVNLPLLKYMASKGKPVFLSTGMCDLADVQEALQAIHSEGNEDVVLLQCTSLYPTEPRQVNLRAMHTLRSAFRVPVGLSDHTLDLVIPAAAVARGACALEKTLTVSRDLEGPDHAYALEPAEFRTMVENVRTVETALGSPRKTMLPEERVHARRETLHAARDVAEGEVLTWGHLAVERPADGIRPRLLLAVVGRKARQPIAKGEAITWDKI